MADSKELMLSNSVGNPEFIHELLPAAERTALLYHLSYLCLGGFPKLESLIRKRALETQRLFGSSEDVLLSCSSTSDNLVTSLFPMLMYADENNEASLPVKYLEKARAWIDDIIRAMDDMVNRYDQQNRSMASCTSDGIEEQIETAKKQKKHLEEIKSLEDTLNKLEEELKKNTQSIEEMDRKIEEKNAELQNHIQGVSKSRRDMDIVAIAVPIIGLLAKSIYELATVPGEDAKTESLEADLSRFSTEKQDLHNKECEIQTKQTELQQQLANTKEQLCVIPDPVHLKDVQKCLSRIQQILVDLKKFWEKVASLLDSLKKRTFVNEDLLEEQDMKEEFLQSIETAGQYWQKFSFCCLTAQGILSIQSRDAYKFLETDPSSLSPEEWNQEYQSVMEKLNKISQDSPSAITE
ncbi:uncharacterized protein LOC130218552 [Danio aesculapii]|uniref:uncharacterized protein LOC130218552 n=1 Tax=Danio aesculapii TaxID=1142201 RepID=UPI0024BF1854|nr:uncharacterized protein LOC130218552 [Danio aesculapii]